MRTGNEIFLFRHINIWSPQCRRSPPAWVHRHCLPCSRSLSSSARQHQQQQQQHRKESFRSRLGSAWRTTKVEWYPIPVSLGIGFLGFAQFYRVRQREKVREQEEEEARAGVEHGEGGENGGRPKRRKRIRPSGPWYAIADQSPLFQSADMPIEMTVGMSKPCQYYL